MNYLLDQLCYLNTIIATFLSKSNTYGTEFQCVVTNGVKTLKYTIGVGFTVVKNAFLAVLFLRQFFFVFHSTYLSIKRQNFRFGVQEKSVQRPLVPLYLLSVMGVDLS